MINKWYIQQLPFDNSGGLNSTIHVDLSKATIYPTHELYLGKKHAYNGVDIKVLNFITRLSFQINTRQSVKLDSTFSSCLQILSDKPQGSSYLSSVHYFSIFSVNGTLRFVEKTDICNFAARTP